MLCKNWGTIWVEPAFIKRGRPCIGDRPMTAAEYKRRSRGEATRQRATDIAILDFETDPFDSEKEKMVRPFLAVLYSDQFETVIIWEENYERFCTKVVKAIEALPRAFTIYAHNGGKFDYMFLLHKIRGQVKFKGRGIMCAKVGPHELRDSFHIIPERLANWKKDEIDYSWMLKANRNKFRQRIIDYCISDCRYLLEIVQKFVQDFGLKLSIGQAAMYRLKQSYKVQNIGANWDAYLRQYFFGGRVECLAGRGHFIGKYNLYDVNSMYPFVMATRRHPIGNCYSARLAGGITENTVFLKLTCRNHGALVRRGENNETSAQSEGGEFLTTIWEYEMAMKYNLIDNVRILAYLDNDTLTDFSQFVLPLYENRVATKALLKTLPQGSHEYNEAKKDDIFYKLLLNNAYGKFAQNPRKFKEYYITDAGERPPKEERGFNDLPDSEHGDYAVWSRPAPGMRFNNVGTAASITGAARAVLMEAIVCADDPIYCDTDSLICRKLHGLELDGSKLGSWDLQTELSEVLIAGKKLYAYKVAGVADGQEGRIKVKSKGVSGMTWEQVAQCLDNQYIEVLNKAPTLTRTGQQFYMRRRITATVPVMQRRINYQRKRMISA